jgi:hypothetical protein
VLTLAVGVFAWNALNHGQDNSSLLPDPKPVPGVRAVLTAFEQVQVVALEEAHGLQEEHEFIHLLLRHPDFPNRVQAVVMEVGNAKYQALIDRYVAGDAVDTNELLKAWRDLTVIRTGDAPVYEQFFVTVCEVNQGLPSAIKLRVLLGEPPIDWGKITRVEEYWRWLSKRDAHAAEIVEREVYAKGKRALLIYGGAHLDRLPVQQREYGDKDVLVKKPGSPKDITLPAPTPGSAPITEPLTGAGPMLAPRMMPEGAVLLGLIEMRDPGSTFVITTHLGFGSQNAKLEPRLASWLRPSIASIKGTWLGALDTDLTSVADVFVGMGDPPGASGLRRTKETKAEAYLYLGPVAALTMSIPTHEISGLGAYTIRSPQL